LLSANENSTHRGRTASYLSAPAQITECGTTAPGSSETLTSAKSIIPDRGQKPYVPIWGDCRNYSSGSAVFIVVYVVPCVHFIDVVRSLMSEFCVPVWQTR